MKISKHDALFYTAFEKLIEIMLETGVITKKYARLSALHPQQVFLINRVRTVDENMEALMGHPYFEEVEQALDLLKYIASANP